MSTKISTHWQEVHSDGKEDWLFQWKPVNIKIVFDSNTDIPYLNLALNAARGQVIIRQYAISEAFFNRGFVVTKPDGSVDHDKSMAVARQKALQATDLIKSTLWPIARDKYSAPASRLLWTGLNEPNVWGAEPPELTTEYYKTFLQELHKIGLFGMVLNFGVGWPGNDDVKDAPPIWAPYEPVKKEMIAGDVLGLHEYWDYEGPGKNWKWWAGRYIQCPWQVPIIIGECGIDSGVNSASGHYGYQAVPGNFNQLYVDQLKWYDNQLHQDSRIISAMPFTYDFAHPWGTFNIRLNSFMDLFIPYVKSLPEHDHGSPTPQIWGDKNISQWKSLVDNYRGNIDNKVIGTIIKLESNGDPKAVNPKSGATGLMQVMPYDKIDFPDRPTKEELLDSETNIKWGCKILAENLIAYANKTVPLARALAGYYGGGKAANDLNSSKAIVYLTAFIKYWKQLWNSTPPVELGEPKLSVKEYTTQIRTLLDKIDTTVG